jgi:hypothetical protein
MVGWLLLLSACHTTDAFRYAADIGIAVEKAGHSCLYISNDALSTGQRLQFVATSMPQAAGEAEIVSKADEACREPVQEQAGVFRYSLKVTSGTLQAGSPAFAIADFRRQLASTAEGVTADLEGDGQAEFFRACTSSEGLHLTIWKGKPLQGLRRWHAYYYLGYDVVPDCTDSDTN